MTPHYMLDTDTASYAIKGRSPGVQNRLAHISRQDGCISAVTHAELLYGLKRLSFGSRLHIRTHEFLDVFPTLPWDEEAARQYAEIRYKLERSGTPIGPNDLLIAAHAIAVGAILVTNNTREYERVGPPLMLENWQGG